MSDESEIRNAVEAAFGPGAFDLIDDECSMAPEPRGSVTTEENNLEASPLAAFSAAVRVSQVESAPPSPKSEQRLVFELSGTCFAIPIANVAEVQQTPEVTWMPRAPNWLRGIASLRGNVISVCDLSLFLGFSSVPSNRGQLMIVVTSLNDEISTALVAERVVGISNIGLDPTAASPVKVAKDFVIATVASDGRSVGLVDLEEVLLSDKMRQLQPL